MGWTINDIKLRIIHFEKMKKNETNQNKITLLDETIGSLYEILDYFEAEIYTEPTTFKETRKMDDEFISHYYKLNHIICDFADRFSYCKLPFKKYCTVDRRIKRDKILTVTKDFYMSIKDERFTTPFLDLYSKNRKYVNFRPTTKENSKINDAITFQVYNTPEVFMSINELNTIQDYLATVHEYSHAVAFRINKDHAIDFGKYPFTEVDSIFFEMLCNESLQQTNKSDALVADIDRFFDYALYALIIQSKLYLYSYMRQNKGLKMKDIKRFLSKDLDLPYDAIDDVLHKYIYEMYNYVISYLVAIELLLMYKKQPQKALDALYELVSLSELSSLEYLALLKDKYEIVPGENTQIYYDSLVSRKRGLQYAKKI